MTTPPGLFGTPDWLHPQPGGQRAFFSGAFDSGAGNTFDLGQFTVAGYSAVSLQLLANFDNLLVTLTYYDSSSPPQALFTKTATCYGNRVTRLTAPCVSGIIGATVKRLDGAVGVTGTLRLVGHNASDRIAAASGNVLIHNRQTIVLGPGATDVTIATLGVEGQGTLWLYGNQVPCGVLLYILSETNTFDRLAHVVMTTAGVPVSMPVTVPPYATRLEIDNNSAAAGTFFSTLVIGG